MDTSFTEQPELVWSKLNQRSSDNTRRDQSFLPFGWRRVLKGQGRSAKWVYTNDPEDTQYTVYLDTPPGRQTLPTKPDVFAKPEFQSDTTTVQIVEFKRHDKRPPTWYPPLEDLDDIKAALSSKPSDPEVWRWVHCTGLHGPTMQVVAQSTGWNEYKFGGLFLWTQPGIDWTDDGILLHYVIQGTKFYMWYGSGSYPVFITCAVSPDHKSSTIDRLMNFVDHGTHIQSVVLRKDPSLLIYGAVHAMSQEARYSLSHVTRIMDSAYRKGISNPGFFYELHNKLFTLNLDVASCKNTTNNLVNAAMKMSEDEYLSKNDAWPPVPAALVSEQTRLMLKDQIASIDLIMTEMKEVNGAAESIVNLAFNTYSYRNNNVLQFLTVITFAALPLSIVEGVFGMNYFDDTRVNGLDIGVTMGVVGGVVLVAFVTYGIQFYRKYVYEDERTSKLLKRPNSLLSASIPIPKMPFRRPTMDIDGLDEKQPKKRENTELSAALPLFRTRTSPEPNHSTPHSNSHSHL